MASHLAGLGNIRDMPDAEFKDMLARTKAGVDAERDRIIADLHKPCEVPSSRRFERITMAMVVHIDEPAAASITVSTDGAVSNARSIPRSEIVFSREAGEFAVIVMPGWLIINRKFLQARMPLLTTTREWSSDQQQAWKKLCVSIERGRAIQYGDKWKRRYAGIMKKTRDLPRPR